MTARSPTPRTRPPSPSTRSTPAPTAAPSPSPWPAAPTAPSTRRTRPTPPPAARPSSPSTATRRPSTAPPASASVPAGSTASGSPAGTCPLTVSTPAGANDCTITNTENAATLTVNKVYSGTDAGPVAITLACSANGTIDPPNPANAATGSPAVFTVHGYTPPLTCTASETVPAGYTASGTPAGSCPLTVSTPAGANDCTITNTENAATLTVNKVYSGTDGGPVAITLACGANGTIDPPNPANAATGSPAVFTVHGYTPPLNCTASETVPAGYTASGPPAGSCPLTVSTPAGANDCTITNTENAATLTVNKVYSGTDAGPVAITLACGANGTIDPPNPANAATGSPAVFTVHG